MFNILKGVIKLISGPDITSRVDHDNTNKTSDDT